MSMNLHCKEMNLWQTPTYLTYAMYYAKMPTEDAPGKASDWKTIREHYKNWIVYMFISGKPKDDADYAQRHIDELYKFKRLHFFIL